MNVDDDDDYNKILIQNFSLSPSLSFFLTSSNKYYINTFDTITWRQHHTNKTEQKFI